MSFFAQMGPFQWPMILLAGAICVLIVWRARQLKPGAGVEVEAGINGILLLGVFAALMGFLGQHSGLYKSLSAISQLPEYRLGLLSKGFKESISLTVFGLSILTVAVIAWFSLRSRYRKLVSESIACGFSDG